MANLRDGYANIQKNCPSGAWKYSTYSKTNLENFDIGEKLIFLGTDYGGYPILKNHLNKNSICYCAGAARDISFEEALYKLHEPNILIFEPTPTHFEWVMGRVGNKHASWWDEDSSKIKCFEVGLDGDNKIMEFFPDRGSQSWSSYKRKSDGGNLYNTIEVQMKKLSTLMEENNHSKIDVLKIDIEGSEYGVIDDIIKNNLDIDMIAVEMHGDWINDWRDDTNSVEVPDKEKYKEYLNKLYDYGYDVVWQLSFREHLLIKRELIK